MSKILEIKTPITDGKNNTYTLNLPNSASWDENKTIATTRDVSNEATARLNKDTDLQNQIDAIESRTDVVDIVANKAALDAYDKSKLSENDVIKVLSDETRDNAITFYRLVSNAWTFIGAIGPYYTKAETNDIINSLDVGSIGSDGGYIKTISETDGKISANRQAFATSISADGDDTNAPTTKAVRDAIKALDVAEVGSDGSYIKKVSETDGKVIITKQTFDTSIPATSSSPSEINAPTTKAVRDAINALDKEEEGADGNYIKKIKEVDGIITATKQVFDVTISSSSTHNNAPTSKAVWDAIDALDLASVGSDGNYIKVVSQTNGKVSATKQAFATSIGTDGDDTNAPTTKAVRDAIKALDVASVGSDGGYIKTISEADGKISASRQAFATEIGTDGDNNNAPTTKAVRDAIKALDVSAVGSDGGYIKVISEADGKISATRQVFDKTITSTSTDNNVPSSKAVWDLVDGLPEPMLFKGSVGTNGTVTWSSLPIAAAGNEGFTYKVITAHTEDSKCPACKVGDTIISNGATWVVIPSGDEPSGTVTSVNATGANDSHITVSDGPITTSGTLTINVASGYSIPSNTKQIEWDGKATGSIVNTTGLETVTINNTTLNVATKDTAQTISATKTFSANQVLANNKYLQGTITGGSIYNLAGIDANNNIVVGSPNAKLVLSSSIAGVVPSTDGDKNLGASGAKWQNLYLTNGIFDGKSNYKLAIPASTGWTANRIIATTTDVNTALSNAQTYISNSVAAKWAKANAYSIGDYVIYNDELYRCITAVPANSNWDASFWTKVNVTGDKLTKVTSTASLDRAYIVTSAGAQSTLNIDTTNTANTIAKRKSDGTLSAATPDGTIDSAVATVEYINSSFNTYNATAQELTAKRTLKDGVILEFEDENEGQTYKTQFQFIKGNLYIGQSTMSPSLIIGDNWVTTYKSITPYLGDRFDLGTSSSLWRDVYLAGSLKDGTNSVSVAHIEDNQNKVTSISDASTDVQYPSAKLLYDQLALKADKAGSLPIIQGDAYATPLAMLEAHNANSKPIFFWYHGTCYFGRISMQSPISSQIGTFDLEVIGSVAAKLRYKSVNAVDISTFSALLNSQYVTTYEEANNKVTSLSASSTDTQYPSAKAVYDYIGNYTIQVPACPATTDGIYVLHATVSNGVITYDWVLDTSAHLE